MRKKSLLVCFGVAGILCGSIARPAHAKVVFTGYADFRMAPQTVSTIGASDALLAVLGTTDRRIEGRNFTTDSLGLFATTTFNDQLDFLIDITYKRIGASVGETRLQYAYLDYHTPSMYQVKAGRVTLPIGYYNQNYFYPFQRKPITPPTFQSAILGLPIADQGVIGSKTLDTGPVELYGAAFVVNGYGPARSTSTFRLGGSLSETLAVSNNISHTNPNSDFAYGGNLRLSFFEQKNLKVGVSGYQGAWSRDNKDDFTMLNSYLVLDIGRVNLIAEGLHTDTNNDKGVVGFFGSRNWESSGFFWEGSYSLIKEETRDLALFAGSERTVVKGQGPSASGVEKLSNYKTGLAWKLNSFVTLKSEFDYINYTLPFQPATFGGAMQEDLDLISRQILLSLTLTY